ncbi:MAG TPA: YkgJ family cysteine cluster protein [Gemmatimonadales bacterium]|jgi:Fe-S-cluster containining protein
MSYGALLGQLDEWFVQGVAEAGPDVVLCRQGCSQCCHGPFDISAADAELLVTAVARLDPAIRESVQQRAVSQHSQQAALLPEWQSPWDAEAVDEIRFDEMCDALSALPCAALDAAGSCMVYDSRPATCRMIGLPLGSLAGEVIENACPIIDTSASYAALGPVTFDIATFERKSETAEIDAMSRGWVPTTIAAALARALLQEMP